MQLLPITSITPDRQYDLAAASTGLAAIESSVQLHQTMALDAAKRQQKVAAGHVGNQQLNQTGQQFAASATESRSALGSATQQTSTEQQQHSVTNRFVDQLFEQLLANRLGLDKSKIDEIKQKIAELEKQKEVVEQQQAGPQRDRLLERIEQQLQSLQQALEQLTKEAAERMKQQQFFDKTVSEPQKARQQTGA